MRLVAIIAMLFGWLMFSASAWAGCPMCLSMSGPAAGGMQHEMADMAMSHTAHETAKDPCASGDSGHMAACSYCLVTPAAVMVDVGGRHVFAYPSPPPGNSLSDLRPAPQAPPPRTV